MRARRIISKRPVRTPAAVGLAVLAAVTLAGCASSGGSAAGPTWVPQPSISLEPTSPDGVGGVAGPTTSSQPPGSTGASPGPNSSPSTATDPSVVATGLTAPIGIAVLPDGTALVGERTSGTIVLVQGTADQPVQTVRTIPGLDASGDGGLLDLAISPTYSDDHLIYAYITTATDNRVVDFTRTGPITPVFVGIPKANAGNAGRIAFGVDGNLYIGTGNAGQPALAQNPTSLAGKVLEVNSIGQSLTTGPPILTEGQHAPAGLCVDTDTAAVFETEPALAGSAGTAATGDEVNVLGQGGDYGWPNPKPASISPAATLPAGPDGHSAAIASGCAVTGGVLYVTSLDATTLYAANIISTANATKLDAFITSLTGRYGRLITVVADPDGSLWLATANRSVSGVAPAPTGASPADDRILHILPAGGGIGSQA